jgi:hypothetical protein
MSTYKIEQARYSILWHKDKNTLEKFGLVGLPDREAVRLSEPKCFHVSIFNGGSYVAFLTRATYKEAKAAAENHCGV